MEQGKSKSLRFGREKSLSNSMTEHLGKLPPQALDMEEAVLGALMLERNQVTAAVINKLVGEDFYLDGHGLIFNAIKSLHDEGSPVDMRTVADRLSTNGHLELIGNSFYLGELTAKVSSAANIEYHAGVIVKKRIARQVIEMAGKLQSDAYDDECDVFELIDHVIFPFPQLIYSRLNKGNVQHIRDIITKIAEEIGKREEGQSEITGVPTGFLFFDQLTTGFQPGELIIIAARPSMGKTTLLLIFLRNMAVIFKLPVMLFSMEMKDRQLVIKVISLDTDIPQRTLLTKRFDDAHWSRFNMGISKISDSPVYINDDSTVIATELVQICIDLKQKYGIKLFAFDYLQLMQGDKASRGNREQEIASISRTLKRVAKTCNVPVIALSQLARSVETRGGDKRPMLSDLRESGAIEQDADIVIFPYRPGYYKITGDEGGTFISGLTECIFAKNRNGPVQVPVYLRMIPETSKFEAVSSPYTKDQHESQSNIPPPDDRIEPTTHNDADDLPF
jgi:replicative DNA helicase